MGKYSKKKKKSGLLVAIALLLLVAVGGTLAYILTSTNSLQNIFSPSKVSCAVVEDQVPDGAENGRVSVAQKTNVKIKNTGDTDAFIRVALVVTWKNADGKVWAKAPVLGTDYSMTLDLGNGWIDGGDGFYYYTDSVAPGGVTGILIRDAKVLEDAPQEDYYLSIEIVASAIQAKGIATTAQEAWAEAKTATNAG